MMKRTILYFSLSVVGAFWLAYGLGYQQGYQRAGHDERQARQSTAYGTSAQLRGHLRAEVVGHPKKVVNAGPEVTFSKPLTETR